MTYCNYSNQAHYPFVLPKLPYAKDALQPYLSAETIEYHYDKHHSAYVTKLNNLLATKQKLATMDLEQIILTTQGSEIEVFNNAAQVWNHTFLWHSMRSQGGGRPQGELYDQINKDFETYDNFVIKFKQTAIEQFGSGWAWLVYNPLTAVLQIIKTTNADNPLTKGLQPLIACDVWEHAYYIDYRNRRMDYVNAFMEHLINWDFAAKILAKNIKSA